MFTTYASLVLQLQRIAHDLLDNCDVELDMDPPEFKSEGTQCEICPPDYEYDWQTEMCIYCELDSCAPHATLIKEKIFFINIVSIQQLLMLSQSVFKNAGESQ